MASKDFIAYPSRVQLCAEVLAGFLTGVWEMGDTSSFSPEETQDEGRSSTSEDTQWTPLRWSRSSMKSETKRLQTFRFWPASVPVSPTDLAAAGFYFVGPADTVKCFCCGGLLHNWEADEDPMVEHKKFFPLCLYVQDRIVGNCRWMPWSEEHQDYVDGQFLGMLQSLNVEEEGPVGGQPEYPYMETEGDRLVSFENWPSYSPVSPQLLARAGFFYTGQRDHVRCFYCDGTLRNWEEGDDPWIEHARWFPRCAFLLQSRGRDFINHTQQSNVMLEDNLDCFEGCSESSRDSATCMEEKLRRLQEERMCKVCMDKEVSIVLVPCSHLVVCDECAPNLRRCPICRAVILNNVKVFLS